MNKIIEKNKGVNEYPKNTCLFTIKLQNADLKSYDSISLSFNLPFKESIL